jgi:hypothetical protein
LGNTPFFEERGLCCMMQVFKAFIAFLCLCSAACGQTNIAWQTLKGEHFIIKYTGPETVARELLRKAEEHRKAIAGRFGFTRQGDFWLWDDRVQIRLFPDAKTFREEENAPAWAEGKAVVSRRELSFHGEQPDWQDTVLPHEISHLLFREFVGVEKDIPLWLNEGVSQLVEKGRAGAAREHVRALRRSGRSWPLAKLTAVDSKALTGLEAPHDFYAQAVSFTGFLLDKYGAERFRTLCGHLKAGKGFEEALRFTYTENVRTMEALERAWIKDLEDTP